MKQLVPNFVETFLSKNENSKAPNLKLDSILYRTISLN